MNSPEIIRDDLLAACWTWAGDAGPGATGEHSPVPLPERIAAVVAAGWHGVGFSLTDLRDYDLEYGLVAVRRMLESGGVRRVELEFLDQWWSRGETREQSDRDRRRLFSAAQTLGVDVVKVGGEWGVLPGEDGTLHDDRFLEEFAALAQEAGEHGVRVAIEPIPPCLPRDIAQTARLVREVGSPHGGLCLDVYHLSRTGTTAESLRHVVDVEQVFMVELNDAPLTGRPGSGRLRLRTGRHGLGRTLGRRGHLGRVPASAGRDGRPPRRSGDPTGPGRGPAPPSGSSGGVTARRAVTAASLRR